MIFGRLRKSQKDYMFMKEVYKCIDKSNEYNTPKISQSYYPYRCGTITPDSKENKIMNDRLEIACRLMAADTQVTAGMTLAWADELIAAELATRPQSTPPAPDMVKMSVVEEAIIAEIDNCNNKTGCFELNNVMDAIKKKAGM